MKKIDIHWYMAVPSMLMVAPKGRTKEEITRGTFNSFSTVSMVTGSVAFDEEVEKATNIGGRMARQNLRGLTLPIISTANEMITVAWIARAIITNTPYLRRETNTSKPNLPIVEASKAKTPKGAIFITM